MSSIKYTIVLDKNAIEDKITPLLDDGTRMKICQTLADVIDPWTPFLSGQLSRDITIDPTGVTYNVEYAKSKYYGEAYTKTFHPLATSHWDEVAWQTQQEVFEAKAKQILVERAKELYG